MALSVCPARHGRPMVSVTITPRVRPVRWCSVLRSRRADSSGSSGSSTTVPGAVLDSSTPAAARTRPCRVCAIVVAPRRATTRTVSASMAASRDAVTTRPSALLTILEVITRMSPSRRSGTAPAISAARSAPAVTSGSPATGRTVTSGPGPAGPGPPGPGPPRPGPGRPGGHQPSSRARSSAARAMAVVAGRSRMSNGSARTAIPASARSSPRVSTVALSWSSTSQPSIRPGP